MKTTIKGSLLCAIVTICSCLLHITNLSAQVEFKFNPILLVNQQPNLTIEFLVHDKIGLAATYGIPRGEVVEYDYENLTSNVFYRSGHHVKIAGKYYFNPKTSGDKFYGSMFLQSNINHYMGKEEFFTENLDYRHTSAQVGLELGYKKVFDQHFTLELNVGPSVEFKDEKDYFNLNIDDETINPSLDLLVNVQVGYRINKKKSIPINDLE